MRYYTPEDDDWVFRAAGRLCARPPQGATEPLLRYLARQHRLTHFTGNAFELARRLDERMDLIADISDHFDLGKFDRENMFRYEEAVKQDIDVMAELLATRAVDDFLTYVAQIVSLVLITKPEIMAHSQAKFELQEVLQYGDMHSFLEYAVESDVRQLSYKGMRQLYRDIKQRFGFRLFEDDVDINFAAKAVAIRNLHTHNSGIIDTRFTQELPSYKGREGQLVDGYNPIEIHSFATVAAIGIDERARDKWGLPPGTMKVPHNCHRFPGPPSLRRKTEHAQREARAEVSVTGIESSREATPASDTNSDGQQRTAAARGDHEN